ncbi:hypothetical protein F4778DRAFT_749775 [Xylariomycetidae sp. FL2044]|nr:hypothetical protein F4778DRAFT_749775 [Xylariomycetidae sp. FL2044]
MGRASSSPAGIRASSFFIPFILLVFSNFFSSQLLALQVHASSPFSPCHLTSYSSSTSTRSEVTGRYAHIHILPPLLFLFHLHLGDLSTPKSSTSVSPLPSLLLHKLLSFHQLSNEQTRHRAHPCHTQTGLLYILNPIHK